MSKRKPNVNVNTLNRLNEEDENALLQLQEEAERRKAEALKEAELRESYAHEIALAQEKLQTTIGDVFQTEISLSECGGGGQSDSIKAENAAKLRNLERILISRFMNDSTNEKTIRLNGLYLTVDCLHNFSIDNLVGQPDDETTSNRDEFNKRCLNIMEVNLSKNSLSSPPVNLLKLFNNVEILDLSENHFQALNLVDLNRFSRLKEINLSSNYLKWFIPTDKNKEDNSEEALLKELVSSASMFFTVEKLNLANNQLVSSNCIIISQFRNLKYLDLSNNNIQISSNSSEMKLPWQKMSTNYLMNLLELNLSKNNKKSGDLTRRLSIKSSSSILSSGGSGGELKINNISNRVFNCFVNLRKLDLAENNLHNIPVDIKDLRLLEELNLARNQLEFLPNELTELRSLRVLFVGENQIAELNDIFCTHAQFRKTIRHLDFHSNRLRSDSFSAKIGLFENLEYIDLSENLFESMPSTLPKSLLEIKMSKNKVRSLVLRPLGQSIINDHDLMKALKLDIPHKKKKNLDDQNYFRTKSSSKFRDAINFLNDENEETHKRINYDQADIDQTEELFLPHPFFLRKLKYFDLSDNGLVEIPADFGILNSSLERLVLGGNCLTQIPISLCRGLAQLKHLDLSKNRIRELTDKLRELTNLESLDLSSNQLASINYELCNEMKTLRDLNLSDNSLETMPLFTRRVKSSTNRPMSSKHSFNRSITPRSNVISSSLSSKSAKNQFTFNLPNLERLDLSGNRLKSEFNFYQTFSLCSKLETITLNSNRIESVIEFDDDDIDVAVSLVLNDQEQLLNDDNMKSLSKPKNKLVNLKSINLSNNRIKFTKKGGIVLMLCRLYQLAPNLEEFFYDQQNGIKLGQKLNAINPFVQAKSAEEEAAKIMDEDEVFDIYSALNSQEPRLSTSSLAGEKPSVRKAYEILLDRLKVIDLSFNNLTKIPNILYEMRNLREIYFNDNLLKKIPNEMFMKTRSSPEHEANFQRLKQLQAQQEKERIKRERKERDPNYYDEDEEEEAEDDEDEDETKKSKKKKKKKSKKDEKTTVDEDVNKPVQNNTSLIDERPKKLLAETLEILHLNGNQIERVPENLFKKFSNLRELKLERNPLKDPPEQSVAVSATRLRRSESNRVSNIKQQQTLNESITFLSTNNTNINKSVVLNEKAAEGGVAKQIDSSKKLPDLVTGETLENLKPLQTYVVNYKNREDTIMANMFILIKDNIDSLETILKLMRRLKMPMDRVEYVCKEIEISVREMWPKISARLYPIEPGKLRPSRRELNRLMVDYTLRMQTWNLLCTWRAHVGADAHSDELVRVFKLMNSNQFENEIYERLVAFKLTSSRLRI